MNVLDRALMLLNHGFSVLPVMADGTKRPTCSWKPLQSQRMTEAEAKQVFVGNVGIGIIGGRISGGLEILDFDVAGFFDRWQRAVDMAAPGLLERLPLVLTPSGGRHVYLRHDGDAEQNLKLAYRIAEDGSLSVAIETRGEGGYVLAEGSPPGCHPSGNLYVHDPESPACVFTPTISRAERDLLFQIARDLDETPECPEPQHMEFRSSESNGTRPGDDFESRTPWSEILDGWIFDHTHAGLSHWIRAGKNKGTSATTGMRSQCGRDLLHVFSTNALPFEAGKSYSKFTSFAILNHSGDFKQAARDLGQRGFGEQAKSNSEFHEPADDQYEKGADPPLLAYEEFPLDILPELARDFVEAGSDAHAISPGYFVGPLLALTAGVIGASRSVLLKSGYTEPPIIWACTIARAGAGKSPAAMAVLQLAKPIVSSMRQDFQERLRTHEAELAAWRRLPKNTRSDEPKRPAEDRLTISDCTFEAVVGILEFNLRGLVLVADELASWLDFDRYSGGGKKIGAARWLPMWAGEPVDFDRRTDRSHIHIPRGLLSVTGSIPPSTFRGVIGEERLADGLLARMLLSSPPDPMTEWTNSTIPNHVSEKLREQISWLFQLLPEVNLWGDEEPKALPLSEDALTVWTERHDEMVAQANDMAESLRAAASKSRAYAARFALIFQLLDNPGSDRVDAHAMESGWKASLWFLREHRRALGRMSEKPEVRALRLGLELLQRLGGRATVRQMCRAASWLRGPGGAEKAEALGNRLVAAVLARWEGEVPTPLGGRHTRALVLIRVGDSDTTQEFRQKPEVVSLSHPQPSRVAESEGLPYGSGNNSCGDDGDSDTTPKSRQKAGVVSPAPWGTEKNDPRTDPAETREGDPPVVVNTHPHSTPLCGGGRGSPSEAIEGSEREVVEV